MKEDKKTIPNGVSSREGALLTPLLGDAPGGATETPGNVHAEKTPPPAPQKAQTTLARAKLSRVNTVVYCASFVLLDSVKQVLSYAVTYYNNDVYPLPQTLIVLLIELVKLLLVTALMLRQKDSFGKLQFSTMFAVPAVVYTLSNNLYFFALHYTTPPVWMILIQSRVVLTAIVYRFLFNKQVTKVQWFALLILMTSIIITKLSDSPYLTHLFSSSSSHSDQHTAVTGSASTSRHLASTGGKSAESTAPRASESGLSSLTIAFILSGISASLSVFASVFTEFLFKNDTRSFSEQQFQIYFFSSIVSGLFTIISEVKSPALLKGIEMPSVPIIILLVLVVLVSSLGGIAVATIVKMLDNIVKIYLATLANILNSVMCWMLFPERFSLNFTFVAALSLVFTAIYLYEKKTISLADLRQSTWLATALDNPYVTQCRSYCDRTLTKYLCIPIIGLALGTALAFLFASFVLKYDIFTVTV